MHRIINVVHVVNLVCHCYRGPYFQRIIRRPVSNGAFSRVWNLRPKVLLDPVKRKHRDLYCLAATKSGCRASNTATVQSSFYLLSFTMHLSSGVLQVFTVDWLVPVSKCPSSYVQSVKSCRAVNSTNGDPAVQ